MRQIRLVDHCERPGPGSVERAASEVPLRRGALGALRAFLVNGCGEEGLAADVTLEASGVPGRLLGRPAVAVFWSVFVGAIGEREVVAETAIEAADRAVIVLRLRGFHRGRLLGRVPTGRLLDLPVVAIGRVHDGQIVQLRLSFDRLAVLEQLGAGED